MLLSYPHSFLSVVLEFDFKKNQFQNFTMFRSYLIITQIIFFKNPPSLLSSFYYPPPHAFFSSMVGDGI